MEEIVNSTPVMLVYPKATSKNQVILVVFQHENKVNHGYTSNSAHIVWFAGIDLNGVLQWSQLLSGRTSVSSLAHPPGQSLREYFAEHKVFELHLAGMLALWWYQFSRFLSRPNGNFFNARKILQIRWLKIHMNLIHFFAKFGKSPNLWGISIFFFASSKIPKSENSSSNPKWRCFTFGSCGWMSSLSSTPGSCHSFNPYEGASQ